MSRDWTNWTCKHSVFTPLESVFWGQFYENPPQFLSTSFSSVECSFRIWRLFVCFKKHIWEVYTVRNTVCPVQYLAILNSLNHFFSAQYWIYSSLEITQHSLVAELITYATIIIICCFHCRGICSSLRSLKLNKYA